ncbi:MAG TPA: serine hydrolase [Kofleriaceae bacterium]|nr:serine hydrolase [Kofleriaceae bacterium]
MTPRFANGLVLACIVACNGSAAPPPPAEPVSAPAPPPVTPAASARSPSGIWLGTLHAGKVALRVQLRLDLVTATCALDSLDQHAVGIPCTASFTGTALKVDVPAVKGTMQVTLSVDGNALDGTWTQGEPLPLTMTRQLAAIEPKPPAIDPALPPVDVAHIQEVLDKDLAAALASGGELAPGTDAGVTIGVVQHGVRRIFSYGTAKPDSVFEIGSVTKTFTGLLLAQLVEQKKVRLDEPVRSLLPAGTVAAPSGPEITLVDLSAQHSGLPRMPDNFAPSNPSDPYADYDKKLLFAFIASHGVALPAKPEFEYSNLGVGLLGEALAERAGRSYEALLHDEVTGPLGMKDTAVALTAAMRARFIQGHDGDHKPAGAWNLDALVGAGGIRSTAADMLTYLEAQLHPDHLPRGASGTPAGKTLAAALAASHVMHGDAGPGMHIALNWMRSDEAGVFWHNGATGAYSSFALFAPDSDFAVVVLSNTAPGDRQFMDELGQHIAQRFAGKPAVSLGPAQ